MGNLGTDELASVPEALLKEVAELESEEAMATGTEPVAPEIIALDYPTPPAEPEPAPAPEIPAAAPVPAAPSVEDPLAALGQGLQFDPGAVPEPEVDSGNDAEKELAQQRYRTLEGKYKKEGAKLSEQLRESQEQVRALEAKRSDDMTPEKLSKLSETELMEQYKIPQATMDYGREMVEMNINMMEGLRRELQESVVRPIEEQSISNAETRMKDELRRLMPDWAEVNKEDEFLKWLGARDAEQKVLTAAAETFDAQSAVDVLQRYLGPSGRVGAQRVSLGSQITPPPASSAVGAQARNGAVIAGPTEVSMMAIDTRLDLVRKGQNPDGSKLTEIEEDKELAAIDAITRGESKEFTLAP